MHPLAFITFGKIFGQLAVCLPCLSCAGPHNGCPTAASFCSGASYFKSCYVSRRCCYSKSQQTSHWNTRDFNGGFCRFNCARLHPTYYAQYGQSYRTGPDHPEGSELASDKWSDLLINCINSSIDVEEHTNLKEHLSGKVDHTQLSFRKSQQTIGNNAYLPLKRVIDIVLSACLLILLLPFMSFVALLIMVESSGGPVYQQRRVGFRGSPFTIYKFRTMRTAVGGEEAKFAEQDDLRITRIGKVLRNKRIDELPQLWNVLIGEMSLIGPRPEQLKLIGSIQNEIPAFSLRHSLRPGITGGPRSARVMPMTYRRHARAFL